MSDLTVLDILEFMGHDPVEVQTFLERYALREKWLRYDQPEWAWRVYPSGTRFGRARRKVRRTDQAAEWRREFHAMIFERARADAEKFRQIGGDYVAAHILAGEPFDAWPQQKDAWLYTEMVDRILYWARELDFTPQQHREAQQRHTRGRSGRTWHVGELDDVEYVEEGRSPIRGMAGQLTIANGMRSLLTSFGEPTGL